MLLLLFLSDFSPIAELPDRSLLLLVKVQFFLGAVVSATATDQNSGRVASLVAATAAVSESAAVLVRHLSAAELPCCCLRGPCQPRTYSFPSSATSLDIHLSAGHHCLRRRRCCIAAAVHPGCSLAHPVSSESFSRRLSHGNLLCRCSPVIVKRRCLVSSLCL